MAQPLVTIGISYYNPGRFLRFAIQSVFAQSLQDWQLVLVNDGSTDDSPAFVRSISDSRVLSVDDGCNRGLPARLNQIAVMAESPFLARMDADDMMHPMRLARQLTFLQENQNVDVVGSYAYSIDADNRPIGLRGADPMPCSPYDVLSGRRLIHPSVMAATRWFRSNAYSTLYPRAEDVELWTRTVNSSTFRCIPECLLFYREVGVPQLEKYIATSTQVRTIADSIQSTRLSRAQRSRVIASRRAKEMAYVVAHCFGLEERLVRRRAVSLGPTDLQAADAAIDKIMSTAIPERQVCS
jgi:glycosyltransferase involved in cell wall biosynthesis